jgi:SH3 domain-containing YSC84-like protein 1
VVKVRHDINIKFYGKEFSVEELMNGTVPPPPAAKPLYDKLAEYKALMLARNFGAVDARTARLQQANNNSYNSDAGDYPGSTTNNNNNNNRSGSSASSDYLFGGSSQSKSQQQSRGSSGSGGYGQQQQPQSSGRTQAAASGAYNAFNSATPEQRQQAMGAAQNVYNRATPEQRQQAFNAVSSAAADDVFV